MLFEAAPGSTGLAWAPADVADRGESFEITVDLPGIPKDRIDLRVTGSTVVVQGNRTEEKEAKGPTYLRRDRTAVGFRQEIELPEPVRSAEVTARYENGVLRLTAPKEHPVVERKVPIQ